MTATEGTPLSEEELAAIKARADAATLGPWIAVNRPYGNPRHRVGRPRRRLQADSRYGRGPVVEPLLNCRSSDEEEAALNAEFVAHAREDVPRLLAEIVRLRRENALLSAAVPRSGAGADILCAPTHDATVMHVAGHPAPDRRVVDAIIADLNQRGYSGEDV